MRTMLAARAHHGSTRPHLDTIPLPELGTEDVLVKIAAAGVSPGMMRLLKMGRFRHLPTTLGPEGAGTVAAIGPEVIHPQVGDRVRVHPT